jgi:dihydroorotase
MAAPLLVHNSAPSVDVLIREAHVVDPRAGIDEVRDVLVRGGEIAEIGAAGTISGGGRDSVIETIEAAGRHLFPAFVDPHVHLRTPGQEHKEDLETGTRSGAAGGFCALLAMPNTDPVLDSGPLLRSVRDAAGRDARIPVGFLPAVTRGMNGTELTEMAELREEGAAGFTDDGRPVVSAGMLRKALQYQRLCGGVIALHEEDPTLSGKGAMHEGDVSAQLGVTGIPSISESTMVARDALIAEYEGGRIHIQHLSARESVQALADAKERGVQITGEASPHHLCLTHDAVRTLDTRMKMNPPLRTEEDRQALIAGLKSGVIDCIATDHAPHARDEKEVPFEQAPMGTTGLETSFAAIYTNLVLPGVLTLELLLRRLTDGAALFGLPTPGIAPGEPANLTLVDLEREWVVGDGGYESRSANCCFDGQTLRGKVLLTIAAGTLAFRARQLEVVR